MTVNEFIERARTTEPDTSVVRLVENKFGEINDSFVKQLLSVRLNDNFLESDDILRFLSLAEILNADESLGTNFSSRRIIPFFDTGDNDFIVYLLKNKKWAFMNIIDEAIFDETNSLEELL